MYAGSYQLPQRRGKGELIPTSKGYVPVKRVSLISAVQAQSLEEAGE